MDANKLYTKFSIEKIWNKLKQHDKAMNSILLILLPSNWVEVDGVYKNTVQYSGFKSSDKLTVDLYDDGNLADLQLTEYEHYIDGFEIIDGALVAIASVKPTQTMTVVVKGGFQANESEVGDLSVIEDELNFLANRPVNNNLLINSNFANPVNQRGVTSKEAGALGCYTIDRWKALKNIGVSIADGYVELSRGDTEAVSISFTQVIEESLLGKTVTFSAKLYDSDDIISITATVPKDCPTSDINYNTSYTNGVALGIIVGVDGLVTVRFMVQNNSTVKLEWAKLELGEVATPYVPRLYQEEWLLCQRYYQYRFATVATLYELTSNQLSFDIDLYFNMRTNPTVTLGNPYISKNGSINPESGFAVTFKTLNPRRIQIIATKSSHGLTVANLPVVSSDMRLDAEL